MGADGGVVYVPLRNGTDANYNRVMKLLKPFWQFLSLSGSSEPAEEGYGEWVVKHLTIEPPAYIQGLYGTDRGDNFELGDLRDLCGGTDEVYALTFDELDLNCRTSPFEVTGSYQEHPPLLRLWFEHFQYRSREETLEDLGPLASMLISDWAKELAALLRFDQIVHDETWT